jgi:hypothetical protein
MLFMIYKAIQRSKKCPHDGSEGEIEYCQLGTAINVPEHGLIGQRPGLGTLSNF